MGENVKNGTRTVGYIPTSAPAPVKDTAKAVKQPAKPADKK